MFYYDINGQERKWRNYCLSTRSINYYCLFFYFVLDHQWYLNPWSNLKSFFPHVYFSLMHLLYLHWSHLHFGHVCMEFIAYSLVVYHLLVMLILHILAEPLGLFVLPVGKELLFFFIAYMWKFLNLDLNYASSINHAFFGMR